jgi:hypothetical protein
MSYRDLILLITDRASQLSGVALKLIFRLISIAIQQRSNVVTISCSELARQLGVSRDAITAAHRQLATIFPIETSSGSSKSTFTLPADWFEEWELSAEIRESGKLLHMTRKSAGPAWKYGSDLPGNQAGKLPRNQAGAGDLPEMSVGKPGSMWGKTRQVLQNLPGFQAGTNKERTCARRVDSTSSSCTPSGLVVVVDRALGNVEILPEQKQDAEILREMLCEYRATFNVAFVYPGGPDRVVIARILAIAPIDELCGVLRKLLTDRVRPGTRDMWFFTVLMEKIHGVDNNTVRDRIAAMKRKKPPMNETLPNFGPELLGEVAAGMRHF